MEAAVPTLIGIFAAGVLFGYGKFVSWEVVEIAIAAYTVEYTQWVRHLASSLIIGAVFCASVLPEAASPSQQALVALVALPFVVFDADRRADWRLHAMSLGPVAARWALGLWTSAPPMSESFVVTAGIVWLLSWLLVLKHSRSAMQYEGTIAHTEAMLKNVEAETRVEVRNEVVTQMKSEQLRFDRYLSHEMRTPLNDVTRNIQILEATGLNRDQQELVDAILTSSETLSMINGILGRSKLEAGKPRLKQLTYDLEDTIEGSVTSLASASAAKGLEMFLVVDPNFPAMAFGDPRRLRQILVVRIRM
eukprot:TRINITY_DN50_c0_g1_i1.p2 TRINITY_DN50_c0_g1~~TRINITY_DN50_c0_g1_i1.p2  ORF type:complete len:306 (-),score=79.86 TRINITY_DN50_c0_g1_i1:840-1757(-)